MSAPMSHCRVGKAKRDHHLEARPVIDGGHGARAPLPTLRTDVRSETIDAMAAAPARKLLSEIARTG